MAFVAEMRAGMHTDFLRAVRRLAASGKSG